MVNIFNTLEDAKCSHVGGDCEVLATPMDVYLGEDVLQPDLVIGCDPAKKLTRGIEGAPNLVVEILSPSTATKDTVRKRWTYESASVAEYLIVDPNACVEMLLHMVGGRYEGAARVEWRTVVALLGRKLTVTLGEIV